MGVENTNKNQSLRERLAASASGETGMAAAEAPDTIGQMEDIRQPAASAPEAQPATTESTAPHFPAGSAVPMQQRRTSARERRTMIETEMRSAKRHLVTVGIFSLAVNILVLVLPVFLFQVSDRVLTSRSLDTLFMLVAVVIGALALQSLLDVARRLLLMRIATQVETTLGAEVLAAAIKAAQQGSTREFQSLLDLQQLRHFITGPTLLTIFDAPVAPVYFLAVFLVHPVLGIILVVSSIILIAIAFVNRRVTAVPFAQAGGYATRATQQVEAMARNAQVMNAMGMIREGTILWGRETAASLKAQVTAQDRNVYLTGVTKFARLATQVAMLGFGAVLVLKSELTGGMMIAASIIGSRALSPVEGLIEGWRSILQARTAYARVQTLLSSTPLNQDRLQLPRPEGRLHVDRVLYVPPPAKKVVLNGVDFTLDPGESLAIVGPSGTGKSTLARMLVGSISPTSGSVRLDLMDIRNWDPRQFGESIGYLAQDVELFPATVKANIARLREDVGDEEIFNAAELAGIHEMISNLPQGYETPIGLDGSPLSGGQKQRIGLARAFFGRPRLVVLDEPNSNLDTAGEAALAKALVAAKQLGITVVAVTQRPSLLRSVDKIMLLTEGKVQALGTRDDMLMRLQKRQAIESAA